MMCGSSSLGSPPMLTWRVLAAALAANEGEDVVDDGEVEVSRREQAVRSARVARRREGKSGAGRMGRGTMAGVKPATQGTEWAKEHGQADRATGYLESRGAVAGKEAR